MTALVAFLAERMDWIVILVGFALILVFIDFRLAKLFTNHERREQEMWASLSLVAEGANGNAVSVGRKVAELRADVDKHRSVVVELEADVRMHDKRLGAVEERLMRAALLVPTPRRPPGEMP